MKPRSSWVAVGIATATILVAIEIRGAGIPETPSNPATPPVSTQPQPPPSLDKFLAWDTNSKEVTVTNGTRMAHFSFSLTNISTEAVIITSAIGSCGCTVAQLPEQPWKVAPGTNGVIEVSMNVQGKLGIVFKTVTVSTEKHGSKVLMVKTIISPPQPTAQMQELDRAKNQQMSMTDRQAVFKNDCARCHVEPTKDKMGQELFASACGICHEAEHRATMVPNLHALPDATNPEFWHNWITYGKPGTLMPAFAQSEGGILTDAQIASLVNYISAIIPAHPATAKSANSM